MQPKENQQGFVLKILSERRYGYLTPISGNGEEIFFHKSGCPDWKQLTPGDKVSYTEMPSSKGNKRLAVKVTKVK